VGYTGAKAVFLPAEGHRRKTAQEGGPVRTRSGNPTRTGTPRCSLQNKGAALRGDHTNVHDQQGAEIERFAQVMRFYPGSPNGFNAA
jgi:hypothetical protein